MAAQLIAVNREVEVELNERGKARTGATATVALLGIAGEIGSEAGGWAGVSGPSYLVLGEGLSQPQFVGPADVVAMRVVG